ncbi:MAG: hypothetical protein NTY66_01875 [Candidatus Vogelbacteria bacterium]|nr:hypothetical protein [Candidatus Vogelbacteria bacterium]
MSKPKKIQRLSVKMPEFRLPARTERYVRAGKSFITRQSSSLYPTGLLLLNQPSGPPRSPRRTPALRSYASSLLTSFFMIFARNSDILPRH